MAETPERRRQDELDDLLREAVTEYAEWARLGVKSRRYYHNRQWDDAQILEGEQRLRITAQIIRRDIDQQKARVSDAEPTMETQGRGPEDWDMGQRWRDLLRWSERWTGTLHDSVYEVRDRVYDNLFQVGEGVEKVIWDQDEEQGLGMVVSEAVDPFHLVWDDAATSVQRRDARWMCEFKPVYIEDLEQEFPKLKGKIQEDVPSFFLGADGETSRATEYGDRGLQRRDTATYARQRKPKAYRKEWWFKKLVKRTVYYLNGRLAEVPDGEEMVRMTDEIFAELSPEEQAQFEAVEATVVELWSAVQVNSEWAIPEHLHEYDESQGGDSEYPYAFFSGVWDPTQTHCRGEIEYLMGFQDVVNHATSRFLEAMFLANSQWLETEIGAYPRTEEAKFQWVGRRAFQRIRKYPGTQSAEWRTANPVSAQLYQSGINFIKELKDENSTIRDVNRAAPQYDLSGVAVQALQADADLLGTTTRIHIESGLRQATLLRISRFQQFFRAARALRILPQTTDEEGYNLYVGRSEDAVRSTFNLQQAEGQGDGQWRNPQQQPGQILVINDASIRKFDLKLELSSGRERDKAERQRLVQMMLQYVGPAAGPGLLKWAARLFDLPNRDVFEQELDKADQAQRVVQQVQQIQEQAGVGLEELAMMAAQLKQAKAGQTAGMQPPGGPAAGPGPAPGPASQGVAA